MKAFQEEVLGQLRKADSDLAKPHAFEFYLRLPNKAFAEKAAVKFRESGFSAAAVSRSDSAWLCTARKTIVPATTDLGDHARFFKEIAAALQGDFDGWEAQVVELA